VVTARQAGAALRALGLTTTHASGVRGGGVPRYRVATRPLAVQLRADAEAALAAEGAGAGAGRDGPVRG
jgi:hypothetical protein